MQNRFTLKDFVFLVLLLGVGLSVWLSMVQSDRLWKRLQAIEGGVVEVERHLSRLEASLESRMMSQGAPSSDSGSREGSDPDAAPSWARPGVPVAWQKPWTYATDPRTVDGYRSGGEFVEAFESQFKTVVPYLFKDVYGRRVGNLVVEPLATFDPKTLEIRGVLADAWQIDPEWKWIRVHINPRARFSDGQPVTAEDVRWTFQEFILNPAIEAARTRSTLEQVSDVVIVDPRTVEFVFRDAIFTNLEYTLAQAVLPSHFYSRFEPNQINGSTGMLMGSGPFKMESLEPEQEWKPGSDLVLVRNEQHWGTARPPVDRIRFKVVNNDLSRLTAFEAGEADMILPTAFQFRDRQQRPEWKQKARMLEWFNIRSGWTFITWQCGLRNEKLTPFHDRRVRVAMTMLLDREAMIRDVWGGVGSVPTGPSLSVSPMRNPKITAWPYDLDAARKLLTEAGWVDRDGSGTRTNEKGEPFVFELMRPSGSEVGDRVAAYLKDQCAKVGIRCEPRTLDWSVFLEDLKRRNFDAAMSAWSPNSPESDPRQVYHSAAMAQGGDNSAQWSHPEADRLIDAGRHELDPTRRYAIWHQLEALLHEEQPQTMLREQPWLRFVQPRVGNVHMYRTGAEPWEFFVGSGASGASVLP